MCICFFVLKNRRRIKWKKIKKIILNGYDMYIMNMYNCIKVIFDNFFYLELRLIIIINFIFYCFSF